LLWKPKPQKQPLRNICEIFASFEISRNMREDKSLQLPCFPRVEREGELCFVSLHALRCTSSLHALYYMHADSYTQATTLNKSTTLRVV
jgi:hypothetical protein